MLSRFPSRIIPVVAALALAAGLPQVASADQHRNAHGAYNTAQGPDRHAFRNVGQDRWRRHDGSHYRRYDHRKYGRHHDRLRGYGHHRHHRRGYGYGHHRHHYRGHEYRHHGPYIRGIIVPHVSLHLDLTNGRSYGHIAFVE